MTEAGLLQIVVFGLGAALTAFFAFMLVSRHAERRRPKRDDLATSGDAMVLLFRKNQLIDANFAAHKYLETFDQNGRGLPALRRALHTMFDDAETLLQPRTDGLRVTATSRDGTMQAIAETLGTTLRLKLSSRMSNKTSGEDIHRLAAQEAELETLRETIDSAPYLVWRETRDGTPIWVNSAYVDGVRRVFGNTRATEWPLPKLFEDLELGASQRKSITHKDDARARWFECSGVAVGEDRLYTAFNANSIVRAETQLKDFTQTLAKTFADLTVGLAIFDRSRKLRLFNPALTELTTLQAEFLTQRPKLTEFLDRLRENRVMPEPKNYKEWRSRIAELEAQAENGSYSETWSLPGNLTYRITGRPHPDGAIAFLFEDITAEVTLTRQFRRELEIGQALLDNMLDATAHFSRAGALIQANKAYRDLWSEELEKLELDAASLDEGDVIGASRIWLAASEPTPVWGDVREFVLETAERTEWDAQVTLRSGTTLECRFIPMIGGGSQLIFRTASKRAKQANSHLELVH